MFEKIRDNFIWLKGDFDEGKALVDLIMLSVNNKVSISIRDLSKRWHCSTTKVRKIISILSDENLIKKNTLSNTRSTIVITVDSAKKTKKKNTLSNTLENTPRNTLYQSIVDNFDTRYKSMFNDSFVWSAKEGKAINGIIQKLQFKMKKKGTEITDDQTKLSFKVFLDNITDKWILANYSPTTLNSKFNEIISQIYANHNSVKNGDIGVKLTDNSKDKYNGNNGW